VALALPFDALIFDCDGVLVESERVINDVESRLFSDLGLSLSPEDARARFKGHTVGEIVALAEGALGAPLPPDWLYDWGMHVALGFADRLRAVPGVQPVLERLGGRGATMAVASQAPRARVDLALSLTRLAGHFDGRVFTAALVPRAKPSPDVFLLAAARLGVEPSRCAVIEDSPSGVAAAMAAGMSAFGYAADEDRRALAAAGATIFDDMRELPALLERAEPRVGASRAGCEAVERLRDAYARLAAGDVRSIAAFLADDVVYHLPGRHLGGGTLRGREETLARMAKGGGACDSPPAMRLDAVVAAGDVLLSVERLSARRLGRVLDQDVCVVWRLAGGRCAEIWARFAAPLVCDRFWEGL
jgi:HAD superfamily hydrolase (TIGR01509 family)